jgi:ABC-type multidrug transport system ATPase subunit
MTKLRLTVQLLRQQGFVNQYDGLLPSLTVWETIKYSALLRLPPSMTTREKLYRAAYIMHIVEIAHIAHCQLGNLTGGNAMGGNSKVKGISGGQRRRLAIALELLPNPSIIMLDEVSRALLCSVLKLMFSQPLYVSVADVWSRWCLYFENCIHFAESQ